MIKGYQQTTKQSGLTIVELLIVIAIIGILVAISVGQFTDAGKLGRDSQRHNAVMAIKSQLEEYYQDKGGYPAVVSNSTLHRLNADLLISPDGTSLNNHPPVGSEFEARETAASSANGSQYVYIAYPETCTTHCSGYILATGIEKPTIDYNHPYILSGTYNN